MNRIMKSSNKGNKNANFSLKCLKSLQRCIKDLKKSIRQMQFESQRIQKHVIQQVLNFSNNLLIALTSCNLYRINFQEEMYYLNQLEKIERGINEIANFVTKLVDRKYFTSIGNNKANEDLFYSLETTFDGFVGPLLHIFNSFNLNWLVFQCDSLKLFLLDEFNSDLISKKLGITNFDGNEITQNEEQADSTLKDKNNIVLQNSRQSLLSTFTSKLDINNSKELVSNSFSTASISSNSISSKIQGLKNLFKENQINRKQFLTDIINAYKQLVPENTCLCDLAILIDFLSDSNPSKYSQIFLEFYINIFDFQTSQKISLILKKTPNFQTLNKYCRLIFYNNDLMSLSSSEIIQYLDSSSSYEYKDLKIKLVRSGFNPFPVPMTLSPTGTKEKKGGTLYKYPSQQFNFQSNLSKLQYLAQHSLQKNTQFSSSDFKIGQEIIICSHYSNFFQKVTNFHDLKTHYSNTEAHQINCNYIKQLFENEKFFEDRMKEEFAIKRSQTIDQRRSEIIPSNIINQIQIEQLQKRQSLKNSKLQAIYQKNQSQSEISLDNKENQVNLLKKKEILFGRKAENNIIKPDYCFENHEYSLSRQQFKITYEDQSNEYNIQCMSHSSLTQFVIDEQGFELTVGAVFIIQDQIAFQVIALKQFSEQSSPTQKQSTANNVSKVLNKSNSSTFGDSTTKDLDHSSKKRQNKKRFKSGRLSYQKLQLFEETSIDNRSNEFEDKLGDMDSSSTDDINNQDDNSKEDSNKEENNTRNRNISDLSNSQSESNENSSISYQSSINSLPSYNNLVSNNVLYYEKRNSLNSKKNSFINQVKQQQSGKNSLKLQSPQSNHPDSQLESPYGAKNVSSVEQSPIQKTPNQVVNRQSLKSRVLEQRFSFQNNLQEQILKTDQEEQNNQQTEHKINDYLTSCSQNQQTQQTEGIQTSNNDGEEVTLDYKQQLNVNVNDKQQQQHKILQSTYMMNSMNMSASKAMGQSSINQSTQSIAGQSLYELEEDPYKDEAVLHIRVLWSSIETEKEDYIFQYNSQSKDQIQINFGSDKENQVRIQDENNTIKPLAHCTITCQDKSWTIISQNNESNEYYSGLALKNGEEIENGLISKKILIENGFNILVQGYIFSCQI